MAIQKSTLALRVAGEIGRVDKAVIQAGEAQSKAEDWYDLAYNTILDKRLWSWLIQTATRATVVSTARYALPLDFREHRSLIYEVSTTDQKKLRKITPEEYRRRYAGVADAYPVEFTVIGKHVYLGAPPSAIATLRMDYYFRPPVVASDGSSVLPDNIELIQVQFMLWRGYDAIRESEKADGKLKVAEGLLERAAEDDKGSDSDDVIMQPFSAGRSELPPSNYWANPFYLG